MIQKRYLFVAAMLALTVFGCSESEPLTVPVQLGTAQAIVAHAAPSAGTVNVFLDGALGIPNVAFGANTTYLPLTAGVRNIAIRDTSTNNLRFSGFSPSLNTGFQYTVFASDDANRATGLVVMPDVAPTLSGSGAGVRFIHLAPGAPTVELTDSAATTTLFSAPNTNFVNRAFRAFTTAQAGFTSATAGTYSIQVKVAQAILRIDTAAGNLIAGNGYATAPTARLVGTTAGTGATLGTPTLVGGRIATIPVSAGGSGYVTGSATGILFDSAGTGNGNRLRGSMSVGTTVLAGLNNTRGANTFGVLPGQLVTGTGVLANTRVISVTPTSVTLSQPLTLTLTDTVFNFNPTGRIASGDATIRGISTGVTNIVPGAIIIGVGFASNATVVSVNAADSSVVMSAPATAINTSASFTTVGSGARVRSAGVVVAAPGASPTPVLNARLTLVAGKYYTIYARGLVGGTPALSAGVVLHNP
jgi:hypothetical protein